MGTSHCDYVRRGNGAVVRVDCGVNMRLSENFSLSEFTSSPTALRMGMHNEPDAKQIAALQKLVDNIIQPLRDYFQKPVHIKSGFRSVNLNRAVGGANNSQHLHGQAADITIAGVGNDLIWQYVVDHLPFDQCILEYCPAKNPKAGWVHVSHAYPLRLQALSCVGMNDYRKGLHYA